MESESDSSSEIKEEEVIDEQESEDPVIESYEMMDIFALPIRAKPLFHNNREEVEEFPLSESKDGLESTSIVVGDGLFRIVKTTLHEDGVPRIDLQLAMDAELTGFQHIIEKPSQISIRLSAGFGIIGIILMMIQGLTPIILGLSLFLVGLKFLPTNLERHRLVFSSCGNSHEITLQTFGSFLPCFRASMGLIGPAMADYIKLGTLNSNDINTLHSQLRAPVVPQSFEKMPQQLPIPVAPTEIAPVNGAVVPAEITNNSPNPMEVNVVQPAQQIVQPAGPPVTMTQPPGSLPAPPPASLPPPVEPPIVSPPAAMAPPTSVPSPAAMAPPTSIPPALAPISAPPTMIDRTVPLDAPLPEAPRVAVQATPNDDPLISQEEQDALLEDLS